MVQSDRTKKEGELKQTQQKDRERPRATYLPLKSSERDQVQEVADREGRSLGGQMRFWVLERLAAHNRVQTNSNA